MERNNNIDHKEEEEMAGKSNHEKTRKLATTKENNMKVYL